MAKTIGGVRGVNEKKIIDPYYFKGGVFRNAEAKSAAQDAYYEYIRAKRSTWGEMLKTRSAIGTKKAVEQYTVEAAQLRAEITKRFGSADQYTIFTKSGQYVQKTAKATVQALQDNTRIFSGSETDTSSWWYRMARLEALDRALSGSAFTRSGNLSKQNREWFYASGF